MKKMKNKKKTNKILYPTLKNKIIKIKIHQFMLNAIYVINLGLKKKFYIMILVIISFVKTVLKIKT
jgi:hypothetical protein